MAAKIKRTEKERKKENESTNSAQNIIQSNNFVIVMLYVKSCNCAYLNIDYEHLISILNRYNVYFLWLQANWLTNEKWPI